MIEIYGREGCTRCAQAKKSLAEKSLAFTEYKIGVDVTRDAVMVLYPDQRQLPIILLDGTPVSLGDIIGD